MAKPVLNVIICSTRPGRIGPAIANWMFDVAKAQGHFEAELTDLIEFKLPLFDEPHHPMRLQYQHEHTRAWSKHVNHADAVIFVTPEYNYGPPPSLLNALDYLYFEWNYKPAGFVSYGGLSAGMRSSARAAMTATTLRMMPIPETVALPNVVKQLQDGRFEANELNLKGANTMLAELAKWEEALRGLRTQHRTTVLASL
jgi:NAD(P)H-dependent FMN reductase